MHSSLLIRLLESFKDVQLFEDTLFVEYEDNGDSEFEYEMTEEEMTEEEIECIEFDTPNEDMLPRIHSTYRSSIYDYYGVNDVTIEDYKEAIDYILSFDNLVREEDHETYYIESVHEYIVKKMNEIEYLLKNNEYKQIIKDIKNKLKLANSVSMEELRLNDNRWNVFWS